MTNWEKYKDEILKVAACHCVAVVNGEPKPCILSDCVDCDFIKSNEDINCGRLRLKWLDEEYKEPSPFDDWEIDDKIEVKNTPDERWHKRYFAGVNEAGECLAWHRGKTSWVCNNEEVCKVVWDFARKVEE